MLSIAHNLSRRSLARTTCVAVSLSIRSCLLLLLLLLLARTSSHVALLRFHTVAGSHAVSLPHWLQSKNRHSLVFTMELAFFSSVSLLVGESLFGDAPLSRMADGWTLGAMVPVVSNGLGGIIVGLVVKYAGGVRKGFGIVAGIIITGLIQYYFYRMPLSDAVLIALPLVVISVILHVRFPVSCPSAALARKCMSLRSRLEKPSLSTHLLTHPPSPPPPTHSDPTAPPPSTPLIQLIVLQLQLLCCKQLDCDVSAVRQFSLLGDA
jgi:hypothetical protein